VANGASVGNVTTQQNYLAVSSCNQDLRLNFDVHTTDLVFNIFNAKKLDIRTPMSVWTAPR